MSNATTNGHREAETEIIALSAEERRREQLLRTHFAEFWASATGDQRTGYDAFISASPLTEGVTLEPVDQDGIKGWWVHPDKLNTRQAILYIHGGGYVLGSSAAYRGFVSQIVNRVQRSAFVLEYPLAPEHSLPAAPNAALAAWNWLIGQGFTEIAIVGDSAGGGLSLVTMEQIGKTIDAGILVAGVVFSPWVDMTFSGGSMTDDKIVDPLIGHEYLLDCAVKYRGTYNASDAFASPLFGDLRTLPPLLIQVGTDERLLDDSRQFAAHAASAGVATKLEIWEGMHHVFQLDVAHLESSRDALDRTARFVLAHFGQR
jgi:epsilon-lactone hydrolase